VRIGLFGGTFDPIHEGHLAPVRQVRDRLGLDRVYYVVTARPPHKPNREMAPALARYAMVELALLDDHDLWVSDQELDPRRPAYTVETLEAASRRWPEAQLFLIIGADALAGLASWRRGVEIPELARVVAMSRPGWDIDQVAGQLPSRLRQALERGDIRTVDVDPVDRTATAIRETLRRGEEPAPGIIPPRVLNYVRKYGLYR